MARPDGPQTEEDKDQSAVLFLAMVVISAVTGFNKFFEWGFSLAYFALGIAGVTKSDTWIWRLLGLIPLGLGGVGIYALIFHDFSFRR